MARRVARRRRLHVATGALGEITVHRRAAIATTRRGAATTTLVRLESAVDDTSSSMATECFGDGALAEACTLSAPVFYVFFQALFCISLCSKLCNSFVRKRMPFCTD